MARSTKSARAPASKGNGAKTSADKKPLHEALGPAAKDFGKEIKPLGKETGELVVKTVRTLLIRPLSSVIWRLDEASDWISRIVSEKLDGKGPEELKEPNPRIALPTLQALIYSGEDDAVREMFSNLLAQEMTLETSPKVHPSFVELIKQMTATDAQLLSFSVLNPGQATLTVNGYRVDERNLFIPVETFLTFQCEDDSLTDDDLIVSLSNLERLGLINIKENHYGRVEETERIIKDLKSKYNAMINTQVENVIIIASGIFITPLGKRFVEICLPNSNPSIRPTQDEQSEQIPVEDV